MEARQATEHGEFARPTETRTFDHGRPSSCTSAAATSAGWCSQPGWRWSNDVKPIAGTDLCEAPHFQYHVPARCACGWPTARSSTRRPAMITSLPSGHDAWVVGDEHVVVVDCFGASNYAKR